MTDGQQPLFPLHNASSDGPGIQPQSSYPHIGQTSPALYTPAATGPTGPPIETYPAPTGITPKIWAMIVAAIAVIVCIAVVTTIVVYDTDSPTAATIPSATDDPTFADDHASESDSTSDPDPGADSHRYDSAPPPSIVREPDTFGEICASGFHLPGRSDWATRSGRGSSQTSCFFANSVLHAYWNQYSSPNEASRVVIAEGTVPCGTTGGECSGDRFVMRCAVHGQDTWITCSGGKNARVLIF